MAPTAGTSSSAVTLTGSGMGAGSSFDDEGLEQDVVVDGLGEEIGGQPLVGTLYR